MVGRIRIAVPVVLVVAAGAWWLSGNPWQRPGSADLVAGGKCSRRDLRCRGHPKFGGRRVRARPPDRLVRLRPAADLTDFRWLWQLNGLLVGVGLAVLLYVACWLRGWRSAYFWVPLTAWYLAAFGVVDAIQTIERAPSGQAFDPTVRRRRWTRSSTPSNRSCASTAPGSGLAVLLAIPMVALKLRALPPVAAAARPVRRPYATTPYWVTTSTGSTATSRSAGCSPAELADRLAASHRAGLTITFGCGAALVREGDDTSGASGD